MKRLHWFLKQFVLRWRFATREPYDLDANRQLLTEIDRHHAEGF